MTHLLARILLALAAITNLALYLLMSSPDGATSDPLFNLFVFGGSALLCVLSFFLLRIRPVVGRRLAYAGALVAVRLLFWWGSDFVGMVQGGGRVLALGPLLPLGTWSAEILAALLLLVASGYELERD